MCASPGIEAGTQHGPECCGASANTLHLQLTREPCARWPVAEGDPGCLAKDKQRYAKKESNKYGKGIQTSTLDHCHCSLIKSMFGVNNVTQTQGLAHDRSFLQRVHRQQSFPTSRKSRTTCFPQENAAARGRKKQTEEKEPDKEISIASKFPPPVGLHIDPHGGRRSPAADHHHDERRL